MTNPRTPAEVPAATGVPQPVAVMMARHIKAATGHLSIWRSLAEGARALPRDNGHEPSGPAAPVAWACHNAIVHLFGLGDWSERTALASGAIAEQPEFFGTDKTPEAAAARRALYPQPEGTPAGWCAAPGGQMPQPGDEHAITGEPEHPVRHCLPGPVPDWHLTLYSEGRDVRRAQDVVPGTPAAPLFDAARNLSTYACGWMDRRGDSPADLAAALDGLEEVADHLATVASQVLSELIRRAEVGGLEGADTAMLAQATDRLSGAEGQRASSDSVISHLRGAFITAREAITGARAKLPGDTIISATVNRQMAGKTAAQVRAKLGEETFLQRQIGKTRPTNYSRADQLEAIVTWMHATEAATYDPDGTVTPND